MRLSAVQPQSATEFYVIDEDATSVGVTNIKDEDRITSSIKWQWSRSMSMTGTFTDIDKATESAYTPKDTDNRYYLRVTASYTDREGPNKSAQATSSYPVQLAPGNNAAPKFDDVQDPDGVDAAAKAIAKRNVAENTPKGVDIGSPIEATDLNPGKLTYTLEGDDLASFDIDRETGQLMTMSKLDADTKAAYSVTVRATDPSGDPQGTADILNSDTVVVNITVEDLDEDPQISDETIAGFVENGDIADDIATFTAVTEDGTSTVSRWSLAGTDGSKFTITGGELKFAKQPDYEMPGDDDGDNMYEVTVQATDEVGRTGTRDVTVEVTNFDEAGMVTLSPTQHRVGVEITATLKDDDDGVYGLMWQWYSGAVTDADNAIDGATSATYTPKAADATANAVLNAEATYRDAAGMDEDDIVPSTNTGPVLADTRNKAPAFKDSKGNTITMAERSVAETAMGNMADDGAADNVADSDGVVVNDNVGGTIMAQDPNVGSGAENDSLAFSLSGADASKFRVRDAVADADDATLWSVQIEVKGDPKFDFETKDTYMVTLTATDEYGETADLQLTIMITDVNDAPDITGLAEVEYAENGMTAVATYTADDPEESAIASWSLAGDDADDFMIEDGVLSFKKSPNYESGTDGDFNNDGDRDDTGEEASDNIYMVTVQATDATKRIGMEEVTVEVTNVEEGGSMRLSAVQPQSATEFYVIDEDATSVGVTNIKDEDRITSSIKWQWSRSMSMTGTFTDIDKATESAYTPKDTDNRYYLRVTASYTDREGPNKSAQATSSYPVQLAPGNNAAPKFDDVQDPDGVDAAAKAIAKRNVAENTPKGVDIGSPIEATDLNPGKLTYTLEGDDLASFDIDRETGQLMTMSKLDADTKAAYSVTVRATDPSGDPQGTADILNSDTVVVNITVEDLDEDPQISDETIAGFVENGDIADDIATFTAVTEDGTSTVSRWSLAGTDGSKFTITGGELKFAKQPDYEMPGDDDGDNMYEVTVQATDEVGRTGTRDVTVEVTNFDEAGMVTLSPTQHRVGVEITATLKDDDDGVYGLMWQWYSGAVTDADNAIDGATSATYTPKAADATANAVLNAEATYRDAAGMDEDDIVPSTNTGPVLADTRNKAPAFKDSKGNTITMAERSVAETAMGNMADDGAADNVADSDGVVVNDNVGGTIMAQDPNVGSGAENDSLAFSLSGADASKFRVRDAVADGDDATMLSVQVEVKGDPKFDHETNDTYVVTLTATDEYGETADLQLTIMITDVNEAPEITRVTDGAPMNQAPTFPSGTDTRDVDENTAPGMDIGDPVVAMDADDDTLTYSVSGMDFTIDSGTGQLKTLSPLDYETKDSYRVTVMATDAGGLYDSVAVTINVGDVENEDQTGYDANGDGTIDKPELITAIRDYLGMTTTTLDKPGLIAVIRAYLGL